jgi:hypothetical protein
VAFAAGVLASTAPVFAQRAPAPSPTGLSTEILALACAPAAVYSQPATPLRLTGGQDNATRRIYASGDLVTINAGSTNGIRIGQEFFVRRILVERGHKSDGTEPVTVRTAGWIKVWAVDDAMSLATVTHSCDSLEVGDYLEPFTLPEPVVPNPNKPKPERDHYARVMPGDDLKTIFGRGEFFTINRGTQDGVQPGAQFVVYRDKKEKNNFLFELGEAVAVNVGDRVSTLRVTLSHDAFIEGDYVAERK